MKNKIISILALLFLFLSAKANVRLPKILASNMVLQQQSTTKLWGWSSPAEKIKITTSWDKKTIEVIATGNANWQVNIQTPEAGGPYTITFEGNNKIVLENILVGEVWVCSGQSNMEWSYNNGVKSIAEEFQQLSKLNIRLFNIPKTTSASVQDDCDANWVVCDSNTIKSFSAVGFYFGKKLSQNLNVPIGLVNSNWGGTPAEVWTPTDVVEQNDTLKTASAKVEPYPWWPNLPGLTYNAMIAPITNFTIAGTIWYQGESNRNQPDSYTTLMNKMIASWRKAWNKDFPFYYVQIAPFKYDGQNTGALLREAQTKTLSQKNVGMVVISDLVNDLANIHPTNKRDVGFRLANLALAETYKLKLMGYKSPIFKAAEVKKDKMMVSFEHAEIGLAIDDKRSNTLFIAGNDHIFYIAEAKIEKDKLVVWSKDVKAPVAVRYQFSDDAIGNLVNKAGLPVGPFRTDNWPVDTSAVKK